jgi:hypothetical protein
VAFALFGQLLADLEHVGFLGMAFPDLAKRLAEVYLSFVEEPQVVREVHCQPSAFVTLTAAVLKIGCFDTASQLVTVSSLAARSWGPSGSTASQ